MMHAPPEHVAHVINSVCLFSGLKNNNITPEWITMNPRNPINELYPSNELSKLGLEEFENDCRCRVINWAPKIQNEFTPNKDEVRKFISTLNTKVLYMHYYPPFWEPVVNACLLEGIKVGLHVQSFDRSSGDKPFFEEEQGAINAIRKADFLTVSQERDLESVSKLAHKDYDKIAILPKSVPQIALKNAFKTPISDQRISDILKSNIPTLTYIGRVEKFKNISWFIEKCLPNLKKYDSKFNVLIIGNGSDLNVVSNLAKQHRNVFVIPERVSYTQGLAILAKTDLLLFFSGFDYSPRIPLEAILLNVPVIMGKFMFNKRYFEASTYLIDKAHSDTDILEYSEKVISFGIPDVNQTISALERFINNYTPDNKLNAPYILQQESKPEFGAARLLDVAFPKTEFI